MEILFYRFFPHSSQDGWALFFAAILLLIVARFALVPLLNMSWTRLSEPRWIPTGVAATIVVLVAWSGWLDSHPIRIQTIAAGAILLFVWTALFEAFGKAPRPLNWLGQAAIVFAVGVGTLYFLQIFSFWMPPPDKWPF